MVFLLSADYAEAKMVNNGKFRLCDVRSFWVAQKSNMQRNRYKKQRSDKFEGKQSEMSVLFLRQPK